MLSTDAMEQRPLSLSRIIEQPSGELPQLLGLKAQIEERYGPPSKSEIDSYSIILTYGWGDAGFIADLDAQEPMSFEVQRTIERGGLAPAGWPASTSLTMLTQPNRVGMITPPA